MKIRTVFSLAAVLMTTCIWPGYSSTASALKPEVRLEKGEPPASYSDGYLPESTGGVRLVDTRNSSRMHNGSIMKINVGTNAQHLNLTATDWTMPGFLTAYPCLSGFTSTSNLNFGGGGATVSIANELIIQPDGNGDICVFSNIMNGGTTNVVIDKYGEFDSSFTGVTPVRKLDTRLTAGKLLNGGNVVLSGFTPNTLNVLNITATETSSFGFLTAYPCTSGATNTSSLNASSANTTIANQNIYASDENGDICISATGMDTHLVVDWMGSFTKEQSKTFPPERILDTRIKTFYFPGNLKGYQGYGNLTQFPVRGEVGGAAILQVTITQPDEPGFVRVYDCTHSDRIKPISVLNFDAWQDASNGFIVKANGSGQTTVCFQSSAKVHFVVDVLGYIGKPNAQPSGDSSPRLIYDSATGCYYGDLKWINQVRADRNLEPLTWSRKHFVAACKQSKAQAAAGSLFHANLEGLSGRHQNCAAAVDPVETYSQLIASPAHHANQMRPESRLGAIAFYKSGYYYYTTFNISAT